MKWMVRGIIIAPLILFCGFVSFAQMTLTTSSAINTNCDGFGCNYSGPTILINEVMIRPNSGDGSIFGQALGAGPQSGEWIELYNPDLCKSIDISCYFLGNNSPDGNFGQTYGGGFEMPAGTIIPPRGFCVVRGVNAPPVPSNLLVQNGGRTVEVIVTSSNSVCIGGGYRLWFPNAGGWFAFYDRNGVPQDAISWNNNSTSNNYPCNPPGNCPFTATLPSYANIPANRKSYIYGNTPQAGLSIRRLPDGGNWVTGAQASATYGNCNAACAPPPVITCTGMASVSVNGGTSPYAYVWSDGQAQANDTAVGLCAGTYCVTVFDALGDSAVACVQVEDFQPQVIFPSLPAVCLGTAPFTLNSASPAGGTYAGPGVSGNVFNTSLSGIGNHVISYTYSNPDGCEKTVTSIQIVFPKPTAYLPSIPSLCIGSSPITLSGGYPPGGTYSGPGVNGTTFDPTITGAGAFPISYLSTNPFGCWDTATQILNVYALPNVTLNGLPSLCASSPPLTLTSGSPPGGTYSGNSITGNVFYSSLSGSGVFPITYQYTDPHGCSSSAMNIIFVYPLPPLTLDPLPSVCDGGPPVALNTGHPFGGTYTGVGVSGGSFDPGLTGPGNFPITYSLTDQNGCTNSVTQNIVVFPLPLVTLQPLNPLCVNNPPVVLGNGTPPGGSFSGPGISSGTFDPSSTGAGNFIVTYVYEDIYGCSNSAQQVQTVYDLPQLSLSLSDSFCLNAAPVQLSGGSPAGGTYSGPGIVGGLFDPMQAGAGTHLISYSYTDGNGCTGVITQNIVVAAPPAVSLATLPSVCVGSPPLVLNGGMPPGGSYSGNGIAGGLFDPGITGPGLQPITYTIVDALGCSGSAVQNLQVNPLPSVSLNPPGKICLNQPPFPLSGGNPLGGTYSGPGVSANNFNPSLAGQGNSFIKYTYVDVNNCQNDTSIDIFINLPPAKFEVMGGGYVCGSGQGIEISLENSQPGVFYLLFRNGQAVSQPFFGTGAALKFPQMIATGIYTIYATDTGTTCRDTMTGSAEITRVELPHLELADSMYFCDETGLQLDAGEFSDSLEVIWSDNSNLRYLMVTEPGEYWVKVGKGECYAMDSIKIKPCSGLWIPNVFTPNDDGKNDRFSPKVTGDLARFRIEIFNRWGRMVYKSEDPAEGWDGTLFNKGSECSDGTYYYIVFYTGFTMPYPMGEQRLAGQVTLLR